MTDVEHSPGTPDTGERREISHFVNAKEAEEVQESKKLVSKTRQRSAKHTHDNRSRKRRNVSFSSKEKPRETEDHRRDRDASKRMVDEGAPDPRP
jgi:hypothetical protein